MSLTPTLARASFRRAGIRSAALHLRLGPARHAGRHPFIELPVALGHEVAGTVDAVGDDVTGSARSERVLLDDGGELPTDPRSATTPLSAVGPRNHVACRGRKRVGTLKPARGRAAAGPGARTCSDRASRNGMQSSPPGGGCRGRREVRVGRGRVDDRSEAVRSPGLDQREVTRAESRSLDKHAELPGLTQTIR